MKVGDSVLCIKTHSEGLYEAGKEYTVSGFGGCENCGKQWVSLKEITHLVWMYCNTGCGKTQSKETIFFAAKKNFILPDLSELESYQSKVSSKELLEIKTLQNQ